MATDGRRRQLPTRYPRDRVPQMRGTTVATVGLVLALLAAPALVHSDEWEQAPSESGQGAAAGSGSAANSPMGNKDAMACAMVGALVKQVAKMRDKGVSEESQLASVDNPNGKLY